MPLEYVNFTKCYHETGTDSIYFFDHLSFDEGVLNYCKTEKCTLEQLYVKIQMNHHIQPSSIRKYRNKSEKRTPANIEDCKLLGKMLCGNEYAFLHKFKSIELDEKLSKVYKLLYEILFMYDASDCFNKVPDRKIEKEKEEEYFSGLIDEVQREIDCLFLFEKDETRTKLNTIVNDVRIFVKSYELPGVVDSWLDINPALKYFDSVFEIMESNTALFEKICNRKYKCNLNGENKVVSFRFIPNEEELEQKKRYFESFNCENEKNNFKFSKERLFQNELINTLTILFEKEIK